MTRNLLVVFEKFASGAERLALVWSLNFSKVCYEVASISRLLKITGHFCKRALLKRRYSAKETYNSDEPTNRKHPIAAKLADKMTTELFWENSASRDNHLALLWSTISQKSVRYKKRPNKMTTQLPFEKFF